MEAVPIGRHTLPVAQSQERAGIEAVLSVTELIATLPARPSPTELLKGFVPPPRFRSVLFDDYKPDPAHPSQQAALDELRGLARALDQAAAGGPFQRVRRMLHPKTPSRPGGVYLDGGFGVGKTHLLAAFWNAAPGPKSYLSFDELVYTIGLFGVGRAREAFADQLLVAVDEWELDDPGNLKLALAFLRGALASGVTVLVTSNTIPTELGAGRFSQKDFTGEIEELAGAFSVLRIAGRDYRHRHFEAHPGREFFHTSEELRAAAARAPDRVLLTPHGALVAGLENIHPIRYSTLIDALEVLLVENLRPIDRLPDALRWVHFIDKLYDAAVPFHASASMQLADLFPPSFTAGPYARKISRCLSRMEEMLGEG
ncbi:MAG TPA: cell division protein ZapE [Longimicrobiaceae bacterium]|nr:cell division protein ZapE [Longimicrobiaceae bacterium]